MDDKGRGYNRARGKGLALAIVLRLASDGNHMCVDTAETHVYISNGPDVRE